LCELFRLRRERPEKRNKIFSGNPVGPRPPTQFRTCLGLAGAPRGLEAAPACRVESVGRERDEGDGTGARGARAARQRGEESGLSDEERAFYDALAENKSARQVMGDPALRVIAHELVASIKNNISVDWMHRETARARMRVLVKRILRKYGYPPDLQDAAVQNVLQQAEALSLEWAA
jgi:hypothetical protein